MRNWNIVRALVVVATFCLGSGVSAESPNTLTQAERALGFELLFDGQSLDGWKHKGNWQVVDGEITRQGRGGSLVYAARPVPDNFELRFEWKVAAGSNSGIYYRPGQYEYQILHNQKHADGKNPRTSAASLYFCMAPSADVTRPAGEWNSGRIVCQGSVIQHWLNGRKVIDFDYTEDRWRFEVAMLRQRGAELTARGAKLSLQDHGDPVWYRGLKWRPLTEAEDISHETVDPQALTPAQLVAERKKLEGIVARRNRQKR